MMNRVSLIPIIFAILVFATSCTRTHEKASIALDNSNFESTINGAQPVLVDYWATWCVPCIELSPTIEEVARDFKGQIIVGKVDIDASPEITDQNRITSIPTLIIFKDGEEVDRIEGKPSKGEIVKRLEKYL